MTSQNEQKKLVAQSAADYVARNLPENAILGVGSGSTVKLFIEALFPVRSRLGGAVASSEATREALESIGIRVLDMNGVGELAVYVDGADEIAPDFSMIKGGGGALTREKIVAAASRQFVCIADASKQVKNLGRFPLPLEVIPMARQYVARQLSALGGQPRLREGFVTDNGNVILDVHGLCIIDPVEMEKNMNQIAGVVTNGLFAARGADLLILGTPEGVRHLKRGASIQAKS